ncbi:MAG: HAD family hydrolase [Pseudonocardiaceae bacterium]
MKRPQLVASDVDGTLLNPAERISDRTRAAVHRVVAAGVPFVLVTGRPPRWIPPIIELLGYAGTVICANGAVRYDAAIDQICHAVALDPVQLRDAAAAVDTVLPGAKFAVELVRWCAGDPAEGQEFNQFLAEPGYTHPWPGADFHLAPRHTLLARPAIKMLVRQPGSSSDAMAVAIRSIVGAELAVTFSTGHGLIEISAPGVTKATGLALLATELDVPPADVVAFGDMPNDLSMLQWAGWGVAMANAHPALLAAADEVTAPNFEDGLALILERWF